MKYTHSKSWFVVLLLFVVSSLQAKEYDIPDYLNPNNPARQAYIQKYKSIAIDEMRRVGIPASIKLAQGILESGDGKSRLAANANNHFGMKCGSVWKGDTYYLEDDDYDSNGNLVKSCFRVFRNAKESYKAHSEFLLDNRKAYRYGFLFDLDIRDYRAWAKALKHSGYATNPRYADLLIGIIEANRLYEYDYLELFDLGLPGRRPGKKPKKKKPKVNKPAPTPAPAPVVSSDVFMGATNEVIVNNGVKMIFAEQGSTPRSIAKAFGISAKKLTIYNELYNGGRLNFKRGDRVYLQPKRKRWRGKTREHIVERGETMYDIAQLYGMKVECLYKKNRMQPGTEPGFKERIALKRRVHRSHRVLLRDPAKDNFPQNIPQTYTPKPKPEPVVTTNYDLSNGRNLVDIIRVNVNAQDLGKKADAYMKITKGSVTTSYPSTPSRPTTTTSPSKPTYPTTTTSPTRPTTSYPSSTPSRPRPTTTYPTTTTPQPSNSGNYHVVQSGDTLYGVAKKYNVSVSKIKQLNGLSSNIISIGQRLKIR